MKMSIEKPSYSMRLAFQVSFNAPFDFSGIKNQFFDCKFGRVILCVFLLIISQCLRLLMFLDVVFLEDYFYVPMFKSNIPYFLWCFLMAVLDQLLPMKM